jgi:hypothetical protein
LAGILVEQRSYLAGLQDYKAYIGYIGVASSLVGTCFLVVIVAVLTAVRGCTGGALLMACTHHAAPWFSHRPPHTLTYAPKLIMLHAPACVSGSPTGGDPHPSRPPIQQPWVPCLPNRIGPHDSTSPACTLSPWRPHYRRRAPRVVPPGVLNRGGDGGVCAGAGGRSGFQRHD